MKAIYKDRLYTALDIVGNSIILRPIEDDSPPFSVSLGSPELTIDPTDSEVEWAENRHADHVAEKEAEWIVYKAKPARKPHENPKLASLRTRPVSEVLKGGPRPLGGIDPDYV